MSGKYLKGIALLAVSFILSTVGSEMMLQEDVREEVDERLNGEDDEDED